MKTSLLPFIIVGVVGITAVGASIYVMKGSGTAPQPQVTATDQAPPPSHPAPTPPLPLPSETTDQSPPPTQVTVTTPAPSNAQPPGPGQGGRGAGMQRMFDQLGLNDAQRQQIAQIRANTALTREQRRDEIRNVLTPEQQTQFDQIRAQMRQNWGNRRGGGPGGPGDNNGNGQGGNPAPTPAPTPPAPGA